MTYLLIVLTTIAVSLGIAEVGFRTLSSRAIRVDGFKIADPVFHHRLQPNARGVERFDKNRVEMQINGIGLRDGGYESIKPPGTSRILMLGDSVTFGTSLRVEETVAKRVERLLATMPGRRWQVINGGVPSYSPLLEYLLLKHVGLGLRPDLIILNFDMTDLRDDLVRTDFARLDAAGLPVAVPEEYFTEAALIIPPVNALDRALLRSVVYQIVRKSSFGRKVLGPLRVTRQQAEARGLAGDPHYDPVAVSRCEDHVQRQRAWQLSERYITGIRDLARSANAPFVVVVYPHAHQIAGDERDGDPKFRLCPQRPFSTMAHIGQRHGFPVVDLLELFRRRAGGGALFVEDGVHQTPRGAEAFADGIFEGLGHHELIAPAEVNNSETDKSA